MAHKFKRAIPKNHDTTGGIEASGERSFHLFKLGDSSSLLSTFRVIRNEGAWAVLLSAVSASLGVSAGEVIARPTEHPPQNATRGRHAFESLDHFMHMYHLKLSSLYCVVISANPLQSRPFSFELELIQTHMTQKPISWIAKVFEVVLAERDASFSFGTEALF
jgi:hypothetical protein